MEAFITFPSHPKHWLWLFPSAGVQLYQFLSRRRRHLAWTGIAGQQDPKLYPKMPIFHHTVHAYQSVKVIYILMNDAVMSLMQSSSAIVNQG
jgi:hypothetical protein